MAGTLVAGAVLSAVFNVLFERMASKEVLDFFKQRKLDVEVLRELKSKMNSVNGLLEDAENKRTSNRNVREWVDDLKDVAYEADDFLDEVVYKARKQQELEAGPNTLSYQVRNCFSCLVGTGKLAPRLDKILAKIEYLLKQNDFLNLEKRDGVRLYLPSEERQTTTSLLDVPCVYGRDDDKEAIIRRLLSDEERLGVVPIVGMGGIGKTTLSRVVYEDIRVKDRFGEFKAWVYVSEDFNVLNLTKTILKEFGLSECDSMSPNRLQLELEERVRGKRILLVLDDVWSDDSGRWDSLLAPLQSAAQGSKVLVTTRDERVASVKSTVSSHTLKELCEDDCWLLFVKIAFDGRDSDADKDLKEIGRKIVRKCDGLPLAAKIIGGLLRSKRTIKIWKNILDSNIWESKFGNIIPVLRISYHYLPPHLKQCFVYCAMFPKDYQFNKEELILLWMAEGFIVQNDNKRRDQVEEIGEEYFEDLLSRSFFQRYGSKEDVFVMHDLINDLAKSIAGEFCYNNVDDASSGMLTERTRHLFYKGGKEPEGLYIAKQSRTLICEIRYVSGDKMNFLTRLKRLRVLHINVDRSVVKMNMSDAVNFGKHLRFLQLRRLKIQSLPEDLHTLRYLQTLKISECGDIDSLPDSIGTLKHLRHLNLYKLWGLKSLPDSICNLNDLRHLDVRKALSLESLPNSIGNLTNLTHLAVSHAERLESLPDSVGNLQDLTHLNVQGALSLESLPDSIGNLTNLTHLNIKYTGLKSMPPQIGKLGKLHTLSDFFVGKDREGCSMAELGKLRHLQGELTLQNLQNLTDAQALEANLKDKSHLETLGYDWEGSDDNSNTDDDSALISLFQHLRPHVNVKDITIKGYRGTIFPNWVGDSSFSNIVRLTLESCKNCTSLPPLGQLASLEDLHIDGFDSIVSVGTVFFGDSKSVPPFRSLTSLTFCNMPKWKRWTCYENEREDDGGCRVFPALQSLTFFGCPELEMAFALGIWPSTLQHLDVQGCNKVISEGMHWDLRRCSSLSRLKLRSSGDIQSFPGMILLPCNLTEILIEIQNVESLDYSGLRDLTSLQYLIILGCPNLGCIPDGGLPESLCSLTISGCPLLKKRCQREQGEDWPKISRIPLIRIDGENLACI